MKASSDIDCENLERVRDDKMVKEGGEIQRGALIVALKNKVYKSKRDKEWKLDRYLNGKRN